MLTAEKWKEWRPAGRDNGQRRPTSPPVSAQLVMVRGEKNRSYLASRLTGHSGLEGGQSGRRFMVPPSNKNLRREKIKIKKSPKQSNLCRFFWWNLEAFAALQHIYSTFLVKSVQIDRFLQKPCYAIHRYWTCIFCRILYGAFLVCYRCRLEEIPKFRGKLRNRLWLSDIGASASTRYWPLWVEPSDKPAEHNRFHSKNHVR